MVFLACNVMLLGIFAVLQASLRVQANPVTRENTDLTYQESEEFKREIRERIADLHKNKRRSAFDRILTVNDIHKRWKKNNQLEKRNTVKSDADDVINNVNTRDDNPLFEGDIAIDPKQLLEMQKVESYRRKRNAVYKRKMLWISRRIPYYIDPGLSQKAIDAIRKAIAIVHEKTCVRWVPYTSTAQKNYVHFVKADGCYSTIGRAYAQQGAQKLSIGEGCEWVDVALHELTHCMGFYHEQSRDDRNRHIKILWENIPVDLRDQFTKYTHGDIDKMKKDYDIKSLMHYSSTAFGINGKTTIVSLDPSQTVGEATTYTALDIIEINALYDCKTSSTNQKISSWSLWSECDNNCYKERQRFCFTRNKVDCPNVNIYGIEKEATACSPCPEPIDGNWGMWSSWGTCSKACDEGKHTRTRQCNNPTPSNGGKACIGASIDESTCINRRCKIGKYDADFEDGWSIWFSASNTGLIPWTQNTDFTKTMNTGPRGDHTLQGKGNYVYVESSNRQKGDLAQLVSRTLEFSTQQCLSFYYSMYGELTGTLTLYMVPEGKPWIYLFTKTGNQGQNWQNADATLDYNGKFQLIFEVTLGGRGYSDTALDDIFIDNGACPGYVCKDDNTGCAFWATTGECSNNPAFMHINCRQSCSLCTKPNIPKPVAPTLAPQKTLAPTTKLAPVTTASTKCEDLNSNCYSWSTENQCQDNPTYMHNNCKASCGLCGDCGDIDGLAQCAVWAKQGYCNSNHLYMLAKCKHSCTGCPLPCVDDNTECPRWATEGQCESNPSWMRYNCRRSCKTC